MHIIALNRHWVVSWQWLLITLFVVGALLTLAMWQLQRASTKEQLLQRFSQLQQTGAVGAEYLQAITGESADGLQISTKAHWLSPAVWLLDNQVVHGQVGYDVIAPMQLGETDIVVLVDLGWIPGPVTREQLPLITVPTQFTVQGVMRTHIGGFQLGQNIEASGHWPMRIQHIKIEELNPYIQSHLYTGVIYQLKDSPFLVHYQAIVMSPQRHRAYALQWTLLAVAVIGVALAATRQKDYLSEDRPGQKETVDVRE